MLNDALLISKSLAPRTKSLAPAIVNEPVLITSRPGPNTALDAGGEKVTVPLEIKVSRAVV